MARILAATLIVAALAAGSVGAEVSYSGGGGANAADAVVIVGAEGESDGVASEYQWVKTNRPGAQVDRQALVMRGEKAFDVLTLSTDGAEEEVWFDITGYFGK